MAVKFTFADVTDELIRMEADARRHAESAQRKKDQRWHHGRASAFREATETYDAARRSAADNGAPVEMRRFNDIVEEQSS